MISFWYQLGLFTTGIAIFLHVWQTKNVRDWCRNRSRFAKIASQLPGPRCLPLIGNALSFACNADEILIRFLKLCKPYGGLVRIWLGPKLIVAIKNPEDIKTILQSANATHKDSIYRFAEKLFGVGLLTASGPTVEVHRKVILSMLNRKTLDSFVKYFDQHSERCVERMESQVDAGEFDVHPYMEHCAVDSALDTIMGTPGTTQQGGYKEVMPFFARMYQLCIDRMLKIWLQPDWIYACTKYKKLQDESLIVIREFVEKLVAAKKKELIVPQTNSEVPNNPRPMLLEQLVVHNEKTRLMEEDRLRDEILTVFTAGEDSTTTVSSFVLLILAMHPEIQDRVRTEVFQVLGEESVTTDTLSDLKYLDTVIKETLRVFPLAPMLLRELTGDIRLGSCTLPEGCSIAMLPFLTHRDPEYWSDPEKFDPDRFTPENSVDRHSHAYLPYSGGVRGCVGKRYAVLYMKTIVAHVVRRYRLSRSGSVNEIKLKSDVVLRSMNGYRISITRV